MVGMGSLGDRKTPLPKFLVSYSARYDLISASRRVRAALAQ